jgi:carbon dioxide concentrating mechanism protein CcmO
MAEDALGLLEIRSWSAAMAALDAAEKAGDIELLQVELNDFYGAVIKLTGSVADVRAAVAAGSDVARDMRIEFVADVIPRPSGAARPAYDAPREFNVLIEQDVVHIPRKSSAERPNVSEQQRQLPYAIGMIETQGFTAVIEAIDTAVKAAAVEVIAKEKLGGGYVTVLIRGDVAAVQAAIDAGRAKVEGLGKLIAAHVIPRPSAAVMSLLPTPAPAAR